MSDYETNDLFSQLLWQRFTLSTSLKSATLPQKTIIVRTAAGIGERIAKMEAEREGSWVSSHNTILAREIMADNIEFAKELVETASDHPMVHIFLRDAAQCADHAWAMRSKARDEGPFGALLQLAWVLRRNPQPENTAAPILADAVAAARKVPRGQPLSDWGNPAVEAFIVANSEAGIACGV